MPLGWPSPANKFLRRNTQRCCNSTRGSIDKSCSVRCKLCHHPFGFYGNHLSDLGFNMNLEQRYDAFSLWSSGLMIPSCWMLLKGATIIYTSHAHQKKKKKALHKACRMKQTHNGLLTVDQGCKLTQMPMKWNFPESDTLIDTLLEAGIRSTVCKFMGGEKWRSDKACVALMWHVHPDGLFLSVYRGSRWSLAECNGTPTVPLIPGVDICLILLIMTFCSLAN